jgi:rhodanese-related sulfurtransferase
VIPLTIDDLLASARGRIRRLGPHETAAARRRGAMLIDIRPTIQRRWEGEVPGAVVVERNVLEWRLDPASAHRLAQITDHDREIIVMCSEGYASSLVAATLVELGYTSAGDLEGGFQAWAKAGLPVRAGRRRPRLRAAS